MIAASAICFRLLTHLICWAFCLALLRAGRSMPARIAMMAITTRSSISVKPLTRDLRVVWPRIQYCLKSFIRPPFQLSIRLMSRKSRSDLVRQSKFHHSKISDLPLSHCALETGQAAGSCPNPLCVFATLRLCVEIDAGKTQRLKDAKSQGIKRTRARRRTIKVTDAGQRMLREKPQRNPGVRCSDLISFGEFQGVAVGGAG